MGGNPKDEGLGNLQGFIEAMLHSDPNIDPGFRNSGMRIDANTVPSFGTASDIGALDKRTNQAFDLAGQGLNRNISQAGQLGAARGYSQGLSNPFAFAQRAENDARGAMVGLEGQRGMSLMQNPLTAFNVGSQGQQYNTDLILRLLGMKAGLTAQREGNVFRDDILPAVTSGGGAIAGAYLSRGGGSDNVTKSHTGSF